MTFEELCQEVTDRGYDYIKAPRIQRFVNRSYMRLCARRPWPFLEETISGPSPLEISNVRHVLSVSDTTALEDLDYIDRRRVVTIDPALTQTGNPQWWYLENNSLKTWPVSENSVTVRYIRKPEDLSGSDAPLIPSEYHDLIVDGAVALCLRDDDENGEARELEADVERQVVEMIHDLMPRNYDQPATSTRSGYVADYL